MTTSQPAARSASAWRATGTSSAGTSGAASRSGPACPWTATTAASTDVASKAWSGAIAAAQRRARARSAAPIRAAPSSPFSPATAGSGAAASASTTTAAGSVPGEMGPDRIELGAVEPRQRGGERAGERRGARADQADELVDGRRILGLDAVGVVGRVPEERVRDLRLAGEHRLRPGRLAHRGDARRHERSDLRARVEARAVDVAVAAAVAHRMADLARACEERLPKWLGER